MIQQHLNNDYTVIENFKKEKISPQIYLRFVSGSFLFFLNFMNFYWNKFIDRELAQKLYIRMCLKLFALPFLLILFSILTIVILMINKNSINQTIDDITLSIFCLIIPVLTILINPLLIFWTKKSIINFYYKKYYKNNFKILQKPIIENYYITDLKEWKKSYFKISRNKETKIWSLASDSLIVKDKNFIRENYEYTLESKNEQKDMKTIYKTQNIFHFEGVFIKWIFYFVFLSHKLFFMKNVYEKYNTKISIWKFILINWAFFIILFVVPLSLLIIYSSLGILNGIGLSIGLYLFVIFSYPLIICPLRFFIIKEMMLK